MTIRKLWLLVITFVVVISVGINSFISTTLTGNSFRELAMEDYDNSIDQMVLIIQKTLQNRDISYDQLLFELESNLRDPISGIQLFSPEGDLILEVKHDIVPIHPAVRPGLPGLDPTKIPAYDPSMNPIDIEEYSIENDERVLGVLRVTSIGPPEESLERILFSKELIINALISMVVSLIVTFIVGFLVSSLMAKALIDTSELANGLKQGQFKKLPSTVILEINTIRDSLYSFYSRLKLKQKSRKVLIDELVHQSRTPLTVLKTHLEALEDGILEFTKDEMDIWYNQIENITAIISNMSGMIDADRDMQEITVEEFSFDQTITQIRDGLIAQFEKKGVLLNLNTHEKINLKTDKYKLSQSIYNLLTNAYKFTPPGGQVDLDYHISDQSLILSVRDRGNGIEERDLDRIFEAYYRSDNELVHGEGLGLYIARENLTMIHGSLHVESQVGRGSCFTISIPLV